MPTTPLLMQQNTTESLPPNLPLPLPKPQNPALSPLRHPPLNPRFHLRPASRTPHIDRRDNFLNSQGTNKHREFPKTAVFTIWDTETGRFSRAASLRNQLRHVV